MEEISKALADKKAANSGGADSGLDSVSLKESAGTLAGGDIVLRSGKRIALRKKTGAHHMIENRLLSVCVPRGDGSEYGVNIGDMVALTDIRAVVAIEAIDGVSKKMPANLSDVIELMSEFAYGDDSDEWSEFKQAISPDRDKVQALAKNLRSKAGSGAESALLSEQERE